MNGRLIIVVFEGCSYFFRHFCRFVAAWWFFTCTMWTVNCDKWGNVHWFESFLYKPTSKFSQDKSFLSNCNNMRSNFCRLIEGQFVYQKLASIKNHFITFCKSVKMTRDDYFKTHFQTYLRFTQVTTFPRLKIKNCCEEICTVPPRTPVILKCATVRISPGSTPVDNILFQNNRNIVTSTTWNNQWILIEY